MRENDWWNSRGRRSAVLSAAKAVQGAGGKVQRQTLPSITADALEPVDWQQAYRQLNARYPDKPPTVGWQC
jgi:hypothetical protein